MTGEATLLALRVKLGADYHLMQACISWRPVLGHPKPNPGVYFPSENM